MRQTRLNKGFTIWEVLIALTVVFVLGAIAVPAYHNYFRRLNFKTNIIQVLAPYQTAIEKCYQDKKKISECNAGNHKIPPAITTPKGKIASLTVSNGIITVVPVAVDGVTEKDTYILSPLIANDTITWKTSGGAITSGYAD